MEDKKDLEKIVKNTPKFDADFPPNNIHNRETAKALGLRYDPIQQVYFDSDGCPVKDRYGQDLG